MPSCCAPGLRGNPEDSTETSIVNHYEEYLLEGDEGKNGGPRFLRNRSSDHDPIAPRVLGTIEGDIGARMSSSTVEPCSGKPAIHNDRVRATGERLWFTSQCLYFSRSCSARETVTDNGAAGRILSRKGLAEKP
jgi:hypothetical protein